MDLTQFNTFGISAFCDEYYKLSNASEIEKFSITNNTLILGGGSNILITNNLKKVIHICNKGIEIVSQTEKQVKLRVQAGEEWDDFVDFAVSNNYFGIENLSKIPGTVGASPIQNIGAYGVEAKDVIDSVEYYNIDKKIFELIKNQDCKFGYRTSIFKKQLKNRVVIVAVNFTLQKNGVLKTNYGGLSKYVTDKHLSDLQYLRNVIIKIRDEKLPNYRELGNSGSFFKNAIVNEAKLEELQKKYPSVPFFVVSGGYKIPTAWLIETAGLKGYRYKNAGIYEKHALILVNYGGASASDVLKLSGIVENKISNLFGIKIEKEVNIVE